MKTSLDFALALNELANVTVLVVLVTVSTFLVWKLLYVRRC